MSESNQGFNKTLKAGVIICCVVAVVIFLADRYDKNKQCNEDALTNAVLMYNAREYPDTAQRQQLQAEYQQKYKEGCQ